MTKKRYTIILLIALLISLIPVGAFAQEPVIAPTERELLIEENLSGIGATPASELPEVCQDVPKEFHHTAGWSQYWPTLMEKGTVKAFKATGDVIAFLRISECGGKYLIAIYRGGKFTTHFITSWGYVQAQIAGAVAASWASVTFLTMFMIFWPCPGYWDRVPPNCDRVTLAAIRLPSIVNGGKAR